MKVSQNLKGILTIIGGFCMHLVLGSMYTWASILPYIGSKLHYYNPDTTLESTLFFIPINELAINFTMPLGGVLEKKMSGKLLMLIGTFCIGMGNIVCAYGKNIFMIILGDFIIGGGSGLVYMVPLKNAWNYFPEQKGLVSGIIVCGFGLSSFIFSYVSKIIANPLDKESNDEGFLGRSVTKRVTRMFIWFAIIYSLLGIIAAMLYITYKPDTEETELVENRAITDYDTISRIQLTKIEEKNERNETLGRALFSKQFFLLFLMPFLSSTFGLFTVNALKLFGNKCDIDDYTLTIAASIAGLANGFSRPFWGYLLDIWSFKKTYYTLCVYQFFLAISIYFTPMLHKYVYLIWCFLTLWGQGCYFTIFPAVTRHIFGERLSTELYGFVFYAFTFGCFAGPILTNYLVAGGEKIYYLFIFWLFALCNVLSFYICWDFKYEEFDYNKRHYFSHNSRFSQMYSRDYNSSVISNQYVSLERIKS